MDRARSAVSVSAPASRLPKELPFLVHLHVSTVVNDGKIYEAQFGYDVPICLDNGGALNCWKIKRFFAGNKAHERIEPYAVALFPFTNPSRFSLS